MFLDVYADCSGPDVCQGPLTPTRTYALPSGYSNDLWGDRMISLNSQASWTFNQGRLSIAADRSSVSLTGYDVWAGWNFVGAAYKREPTVFVLFANGSWTLSTFCRQANTNGPIVAQSFNAPFYCNGFDEDEIPMSVQYESAATDEYLFAGSDSNTAVVSDCWGACYGVRRYLHNNAGSGPGGLLTNANDYLKVGGFRKGMRHWGLRE